MKEDEYKRGTEKKEYAKALDTDPESREQTVLKSPNRVNWTLGKSRRPFRGCPFNVAFVFQNIKQRKKI